MTFYKKYWHVVIGGNSRAPRHCKIFVGGFGGREESPFGCADLVLGGDYVMPEIKRNFFLWATPGKSRGGVPPTKEPANQTNKLISFAVERRSTLKYPDIFNKLHHLPHLPRPRPPF